MDLERGKPVTEFAELVCVRFTSPPATEVAFVPSLKVASSSRFATFWQHASHHHDPLCDFL